VPGSDVCGMQFVVLAQLGYYYQNCHQFQFVNINAEIRKLFNHTNLLRVQHGWHLVA